MAILDNNYWNSLIRMKSKKNKPFNNSSSDFSNNENHTIKRISNNQREIIEIRSDFRNDHCTALQFPNFINAEIN